MEILKSCKVLPIPSPPAALKRRGKFRFFEKKLGDFLPLPSRFLTLGCGCISHYMTLIGRGVIPAVGKNDL